MKITALAGGIGAGKFLRGLVRAVAPEDVTVVVNTGDDILMHGLHVSPDLDSVTYWLGDVFDRERGWGRRGETFRAIEELALFDPDAAWFGLGDLDLATHLYRTRLMAEGLPLSEVTARIGARFAVGAHLLPMSDDPVTTRIAAVVDGLETDLHFQEYWVKRRGADEVKGFYFEGIEEAHPAPGVLDALRAADVIVLCPSNPVVSTGPILAVPGVREAIAGRRASVVGISPIVGGAPLAGMADRLMPVVGLEVTAVGAARAYDGLLGGWVIDVKDAGLRDHTGVPTAVTDTIMVDDATAEALARTVLELIAR